MPDNVEDLPRQNGLQATAQRLAIIRAVSSRPHATADELTEDVRAVIGSISRQAVYHALGVLSTRTWSAGYRRPDQQPATRIEFVRIIVA